MDEFDFEFLKGCPRCGNTKVKSWHQLNDDEREIVKRLPASMKYEDKQRKANHSWCIRCWFEITDAEIHDA